MRFRKKPISIEAWQWDGRVDSKDRPDWVNKAGVYKTFDQLLIVPTLEGDMIASIGDWLIQGVKGEVYPCKPDIFDATYEAAE